MKRSLLSLSIAFASIIGTRDVRAASTFAGALLTGNCLGYWFTVSTGFAWTSAGIFGPAGPHSTSTNLVADLRPWLFGFTPGADQASYGGEVPLGDEAVGDLRRGKLYLSLETAQYPQGEIRGQILPVGPDHGSRLRKP